MLILPDNLPAISHLRQANVDVSGASEAHSKMVCDKVRVDARIAILNLMPTKEATELDLARMLAATALNIEVTLVKLNTHTPKHASPEHMAAYYRDFNSLRNERFDGLIITGAPVEHLAYENVGYWREITDIFDWARTHTNSTLYICWAAQAGLYHHYGIPKHQLSAKMFGIFTQRPLDTSLPLFQGFDDLFNMPHSRHTELRREDILACSQITLIAESDESGVSIIMANEGREVYVTGHSEYSPMTLDAEYRRDVAKHLPIDKPKHYYLNDDPDQGPLVTWRTHGTMLYQNWINHYALKPRV